MHRSRWDRLDVDWTVDPLKVEAPRQRTGPAGPLSHRAACRQHIPAVLLCRPRSLCACCFKPAANKFSIDGPTATGMYEAAATSSWARQVHMKPVSPPVWVTVVVMHQPCAWRVVGHSLKGVPDKLVEGIPAIGTKSFAVCLHSMAGAACLAPRWELESVSHETGQHASEKQSGHNRWQPSQKGLTILAQLLTAWQVTSSNQGPTCWQPPARRQAPRHSRRQRCSAARFWCCL